MEDCFDSPRHTKASQCVQNGRKQIFSCVRWRKSSRPGKRDGATAKGAMCCVPRRKKRKVAIFHSEIQFLKTPESMCRCFSPIPFRCDAEQNENAFLMWMMRISGLKGKVRCTHEDVRSSFKGLVWFAFARDTESPLWHVPFVLTFPALLPRRLRNPMEQQKAAKDVFLCTTKFWN